MCLIYEFYVCTSSFLAMGGANLWEKSVVWCTTQLFWIMTFFWPSGNLSTSKQHKDKSSWKETGEKFFFSLQMSKMKMHLPCEIGIADTACKVGKFRSDGRATKVEFLATHRLFLCFVLCNIICPLLFFIHWKLKPAERSHTSYKWSFRTI